MLEPKQQRSGISRYSMAFLMIALVFVYAVSPFVERFDAARYVDAFLTSLLLIGAVVAVAGRGRPTLIVVLLGVLVLVGRWATLIFYGDEPSVLYVAVYSLFIGFVVWQLLRFIIWAPSVTTEVLCAGIASYLLLALLWAAAYIAVARVIPNSFAGVAAADEPLHGFNALYFSIGSLTTGGSGGIIALSRPARMLEMLESITGPLFLAVFISRLVSLYSRGEPRKRGN